MPWYKGNLHCHSSRSDGKATPEHVAKFYKFIGGSWVDWTSRATFGANTVQYTVQDNQEGDSDPANGVITDPVALAAPASLTSIPTLSEWALMLLAGLMLMLGMQQAQRRVARNSLQKR